MATLKQNKQSEDLLSSEEEILEASTVEAPKEEGIFLSKSEYAEFAQMKAEVSELLQSNKKPASPPKKVWKSSWKPARLLDIPENLKDKNYVYRHCTTNKNGNIKKKLMEGWEIDHELGKKLASMEFRPTIDDGAKLDSAPQFREMIIMRLPKEKAEARKRYYREITEGKLPGLRDNYSRGVDRNQYGEITEKVSIG